MKHDFRKRELAPLKTVPANLPCNCIECQKKAVLGQQFANRMKGYGSTHDAATAKFVNSDHDGSVDSLDKNAHGETSDQPAYWLDLPLKAVKTVKIWSLPGASKGGTVVKTINPGESVGTVTNFVKDANGKDYWFVLGANQYTPFLQGYFDEGVASTASKATDAKTAAKIDAAVKVRQDNNTSALYQAGKSLENTIASFDISAIFGELKWVFYAVIAVVVIALFLRISGK